MVMIIAYGAFYCVFGYLNQGYNRPGATLAARCYIHGTRNSENAPHYVPITEVNWFSYNPGSYSIKCYIFLIFGLNDTEFIDFI